jgi:hypothetical protein
MIIYAGDLVTRTNVIRVLDEQGVLINNVTLLNLLTREYEQFFPNGGTVVGKYSQVVFEAKPVETVA